MIMSNEFEVLGLYDHNARAYKKVKEAFDNGEDVVGIVHATGTGKSYIALQLAYDNKDKKILYVVPSNSITYRNICLGHRFKWLFLRNVLSRFFNYGI